MYFCLFVRRKVKKSSGTLIKTKNGIQLLYPPDPTAYNCPDDKYKPTSAGRDNLWLAVEHLQNQHPQCSVKCNYCDFELFRKEESVYKLCWQVSDHFHQFCGKIRMVNKVEDEFRIVSNLRNFIDIDVKISLFREQIFCIKS